MAVTIQFDTTFGGLVENVHFFSGRVAHRFQKITMRPGEPFDFPGNEFVFDGNPPYRLQHIDSKPITQDSLLLNIVFNDVAAGEYVFCIGSPAGDKVDWRSPLLAVATGTELFAFTITGVDTEETTFSKQFLGNHKPRLSTEYDIPGLDESLRMTSINFAIEADHINVHGAGIIEKPDSWTPLRSDFDFDYNFNVGLANSILANKFLVINAVGPVTLNIHNLLTSIGASCFTDKINETVKDILEKAINEVIEKKIRDGVEDEFENSPEAQLATGTIARSSIVQDGDRITPSRERVPVYKLQLLLQISIPKVLVDNRSGCSRAAGVLVAVVAVVAGLAIYFW